MKVSERIAKLRALMAEKELMPMSFQQLISTRVNM